MTAARDRPLKDHENTLATVALRRYATYLLSMARSRILQQVRAANPTFAAWRLTSDGVLLRFDGDWMQLFAVQPDRRDRARFFVNHALECLAIRDGASYANTRIDPAQGDVWSRAQLEELAVACVAQAPPRVSKPLAPSVIRDCVLEEHPDANRPPNGKFDDSSDPRALLVLGVFAAREGDIATATTTVDRALRSPSIGGLSAAWAVTEWAQRFRGELAHGAAQANEFLDHTRDLEIEELGPLD